MRQALRAGISLVGVAAVAGLLLFGSQALRQASLTTADDLASPSPTPIAENCITPDNCATPLPTCVPGEGTSCESSPAPIIEPSPTTKPDPDEAGTTVPEGQIQVSAVYFNAGRLQISIGVLYKTKWVNGADVTIHCTGPDYNESASGTTAPADSWAASYTSGPHPPKTPAYFYWTVLPGLTESHATYACRATATYNGMNAAVSF
jgi:hypothetical protein